MLAGEVRIRLTWTPLGRRSPTIDELELCVEAGERLLVVGPSGSGKSTLLHALTGALGTTLTGDFVGSVEVGGRVGLVGQNPADSIVAATIARDVAFGPENLGLPREQIRARIADALTAVNLPYDPTHFTSALSGGEQQRLVLAGVMAMRPDVIALDEPTSMLDDESAAAVREAVMGAVGSDDRQRTLIVVEHRFAPWLDHVDRVVVLGQGRIEFDGPVSRFLAEVPTARWGAGLWWPGRPAPAAVELPDSPIAPDPGTSAAVVLHEVTVDLTTRTLRGSQKTRALEGFSARSEPGRITAFTGPSGSGKSTVLLTAAGLVRPVSGEVSPDRSRLRPRTLAESLGWVPQNPEHGFLTTSVREEVAMTSGVVGREVDVDAVLELVALTDHADAHPFRLSGGEQRRLALAAALAHRPGLMVVDEPTVGQDPRTWALVVGWLTGAARAGSTVVVSTHDADMPRDVAFDLARRVA